jgi:type II secretory pathway component PulF
MKYAYRAFTETGEERRGVVEASGEAQALSRLHEEGLMVAEIGPDKGGGAAPEAKGAGAKARGKGRLKDLAGFTRQLAVLCSTGTPLVESMSAVHRQLENPRWQGVVGDVIRRVEEGETLAHALERHPGYFSPIYRSLIAAGESGGQLAVMLDRLASMTRQQVKLRHTLMGSSMYPAVLLTVAFVVIVIMLTVVQPRFSDLFDTLGAPIPASTQVLMDIGTSIRTYWWAYLGGTAAVVGGIIAWLRGAAGRLWLDRAILKLPVVGRLARNLITARVVRILGTLLTSRVQLLEALDLTRQAAGNEQYRRMIDRTIEGVTRGELVSAAISSSDLIEPSVCEAIHTGERTGSMGSVLLTMADAMDEDNEIVVRSVTTIVEPVILIVLGVVVGFVAVSMFLPLFDLSGATAATGA